MNEMNTVKSWGLSLAEFEKGGWGTAVGQFKVPASVIKRFRTTVVIDPLTGATADIFDKQRAFEEIATTYINAISIMAEILRQVPFGLFEEDTKTCLKKAVYNAIEYSALNKQIWESVGSGGVTTPNFSIDAPATGWILTADMIGMKAHNYLTKSAIGDYELVDDLQLTQATKKGNVRIIGKIDLNTIPTLI